MSALDRQAARQAATPKTLATLRHEFEVTEDRLYTEEEVYVDLHTYWHQQKLLARVALEAKPNTEQQPPPRRN